MILVANGVAVGVMLQDGRMASLFTALLWTSHLYFFSRKPLCVVI